MPIKTTGNQRIVFCVNHADHIEQKQALPQQSTMQEVGSKQTEGSVWYAVTEIRPKSATNLGVQFNPSSGIPLKVFACPVCGYCEFYHGSIIDPQTWSR